MRWPRQALREARIPVRPEFVVRAGFLERDSYEAMRQLLAGRPLVTGVFAANEPTAIGAMKAIWDAGLRLPEDLAVVGAGNIAHGDVLRGPLSEVSDYAGLTAGSR